MRKSDRSGFRVSYQWVLKGLLSGACLLALFHWIDLASLMQKLQGIALLPFLAAVTLNVLLQVLNATKIRWLFFTPSPPLKGLLVANFIAVFFNTFIPGGIGGEVARWAYMSRESGSKTRTLAAILLDRTTGLWAQTLLALLAWLWLARQEVSIFVAGPAVLLVCLASLGVGLWGYRSLSLALQKVAAWWAKRRGDSAAPPEAIAEALTDLLRDRGRFAKVAALSLCNHLLVISTFLLIDRSIGGGLNWAQAALLLFCYTAILMLPVTLGNWGLSEGTLGVLYHYAGSQGEVGVLVSLLIRAMTLPAAALGWYFFMTHRSSSKSGSPP